jgi:PAS domain S-box-containing protein
MISANAVLSGSYNYGEVARSILVAIAGSYAALDLAGRVTAASGRARARWLAGGAIAMGIGIWEMHFKGLLAFRLPIPVVYHWPTVLLSFVVAVSTSAIALRIVSRQKIGAVQLWTSSLIMGGGIAGLHYINMASMRMAAVCRYDLRIVILSIVLAIVLSFAALTLAFGPREETRDTPWRRIASALVMGVAISVLHYTGMVSVSFLASPVVPDLSHTVSISPLANSAVITITLLVLGAAIVTSSADRQAKAEAGRVNEFLGQRVAERTQELEVLNQALRKEILERGRAEESVRRSEDHLRLVIDTVPAMLHSARPDGYLDFFNQRWLEYLGVSLDDLLGWRWTSVIHPDDLAQLVDRWQTSLAAGKPFEAEARLRRADGEYRLTLHRKVPLRDETGNIVNWYGSVIDIEERKRAEDELRRQKELFQKIFENIPVIIAFRGQDRRIETVNPEFERAMGWTLKEIRGQNLDIYAVFFPDPDYRRMVLDLSAASTGEWNDLKVTVKDGRVIDVATTFVRLSDGSTLGIGQDITERKRAEAALRLFRMLIDQSNDAIEVIEPETRRFVDINGKACLELGYSREELLWLGIFDIDPSADESMVARVAGELQESGSAIFETIHSRKDGSIFPVEVSVKQVQFDRLYWVAVARNITERKRSEEALKKSEEKFSKVFRLSPMAITLTSVKDHRYLDVNEAFERITGWRRDQVIGRTPFDIGLWVNPAERVELAKRILTEGCLRNLEASLRRKDGALFIGLGTAELIELNGEPCAINVFTDITEIKRAEAALRDARAELAHVTRVLAMGELVASIAHEVYQPLTGILTTGNFVLRQVANTPNLEEVQNAIRDIVEDAERVSAIISRVRTLLSRGVPDRVELDINDVIQEAIVIVRGEAAQNHVHLQLDLGAELPRIMGDRVQLQQVLINLIVNGIDAMRSVSGRPRNLDITSAKHADGVLVSVQDSGIGVDPDNLERIFESFFTTKRQGIGMGLSISRSIIESHGGRLWTEPGSLGAIFQFTLPTTGSSVS